MAIFHGLRVLDVASIVAAPGAATILGDFGADVIKVEPPVGDAYRHLSQVPVLPQCEHDYAWALTSRNKRSLVLDLKTAPGRAALHRLVGQADVLVTNHPPATRAGLGLGWAQLAPLNPRLVYASLTGYGEAGPEANKPGYDANAYWARSGLADLVRPDEASAPVAPAMGMGDQPAAVALYAAIVTALFRRERTGEGGEVTTSLLANGIWANGPSVQAALCGGRMVYRQSRATPRSALSNAYRCRDGRWFVVSTVDEARRWPELAALVGAPELVEDERFRELPARRANAALLVEILDRIFLERDSAEWQRLFEPSRLTVGFVARPGDVVGDAQARWCGALVEADGLPGAGRTVDSPFNLTGERKRRPGAAPALGQHGAEILREHGFSAKEVADLTRPR